MRLAFFLALAALLPGCAYLASSGQSADGLSSSWQGDAGNLASVAAGELARRYPPAHTQLAIVRAPGSFGDALENDLRSQGYAVTDAAGSGIMSVMYTVDVLPDERAGYVRIRTSDGQEFSFLRKLGAATPAVSTAASDVPAFPHKIALTPEKDTLAPPMEASLPLSSPPPASTDRTKPVTISGPQLPLANGVLSSLPPNWRYTIPDASRRSMRVSKPSKPSTWRESIQNMAEQAGCAASFDENARRVTIIAYDDAGDAPLPQKAPQKLPSMPPTAPKVAANAVPNTVPSAGPAAPPTTLPMSGPNSPVVSSALAEVSAIPSTSGTAKATSVSFSPPANSAGVTAEQAAEGSSLSAIPSPPVSPAIAEEWNLAPGSLESQMRGWASRAHWELLWKAEHDIMLQAHAVLCGDFTDVVGQVFQGLSVQGNALRVTFYQANNVVEVKED